MTSTVIPTFRYEDAPAAIEFLKSAFGFEPALVVEGERGLIEHAQLVHGTGMIMLGSKRDDLYSRATGATTVVAGPYVIVDDVYGHAARARAAGAEIIIEPQEEDYGGANYTVKDPEGIVWSFGSYNPWTDHD